MTNQDLLTHLTLNPIDPLASVVSSGVETMLRYQQWCSIVLTLLADN